MADHIFPSLARPTRRHVLTLVGASAAGLVLPGLTSQGAALAAPPSKPSGQVVIGFSQEPTVFNPHLAHIEVDEGIHFAVFDPLFTVDENGAFQPALASEVPTTENGGISKDGLHWTIKLRDGVKWHDGKPFTAEDVKFTIGLLVDPDFKSWRRDGHELVENMKVVSPTELTFDLKSPYAPYPSILAATFIVPKHAFDGVDPNNAPFNNAPVGTGPFKWAERMPGDHITLDANTDYFGTGPYLERAIFKYIPDLTVLYTQFKTGDIDVVGLQWITPDKYQEAKDLPGKTVAVVPTATVESLSFNMGRPQFQDPKVREALYMALDKQTIIDALYYGLPSPTETFMPQQSAYYNPDLPKQNYDPEKAKSLLDEAGWKPGADGIREKDGVRLAFSNSTTAGNHLREQAQQFIQQTYKDIGVDMSISNLPPAVMWGDYWMMSKFDSVVVGINFLTGSDPDVSNYLAPTSVPAKGGAGQNTWQYQSEEVGKLLKEGGTTFDPQKRKEVYMKLQTVIRNDLPFLPMFQYATVRGHKDSVEGVVPNINVRIDTWDIASWYWNT